MQTSLTESPPENRAAIWLSRPPRRRRTAIRCCLSLPRPTTRVVCEWTRRTLTPGEHGWPCREVSSASDLVAGRPRLLPLIVAISCQWSHHCFSSHPIALARATLSAPRLCGQAGVLGHRAVITAKAKSCSSKCRKAYLSTWICQASSSCGFPSLSHDSTRDAPGCNTADLAQTSAAASTPEGFIINVHVLRQTARRTSARLPRTPDSSGHGKVSSTNSPHRFVA